MHFRRKRRRGGSMAVLAIILVLLVGALGAGAWLLRDELGALFEKPPEALSPTSSVAALSLSPWDGASGFAAQADEDAQKAYLDAFLSYAAQHGMNSVAVQLFSGSGKDALLFGRDRAFETIENVRANDKLFQKFDPMKYLCEAARAQNLAVLGSVPATEENSDMEKAALRAMKKYGLANVYEKETQPIGFSTLRSLVDGSALPCTGASTWAQPSDVFVAALSDGFSGLVIEDYASAQQLPEMFTLMVSALDTAAPAPQPLAFVPSGTLAVTYPAADAKIYTAQCFVMGTSDPAQPLTLNGTEVVRNGTTGVFGVLVDVAQGDNALVFAQGATQVEHKITRPAPTGGGGSGGVKRDGTLSVPEGSYVSVSQWIASLLYDPSGDNKISETVREGGIARVVDCVETTRSGKTTWAYQLASGDYILAYNTTFLGADVPRASFTGATAQAEGRDETLLFTGSGTPMAYANLEGNDLVLHFYDTSLAADFGVTGSSLVRSALVTPIENDGVELRLQFAKPLHGFSVEYADGTLKLLLKDAPVRSTAAFGKPLAGVSVLLDAGHGADDTGAMGAAGKDAPQEKDVNLAVTLAAKYRLEQLGATVHTIRSDDSFLTLIERNRKITELKPDFFIAVHHNSVELTVDANEAGGTECYYFYDSGKPLAELLVQNMVAATGRANREAKWGYYYVARNTICPSVLLECGFMVNPSEYENVTDDSVILLEGDAIASAVLAQVAG